MLLFYHSPIIHPLVNTERNLYQYAAALCSGWRERKTLCLTLCSTSPETRRSMTVDNLLLAVTFTGKGYLSSTLSLHAVNTAFSHWKRLSRNTCGSKLSPLSFTSAIRVRSRKSGLSGLERRGAHGAGI